MKYMKIWIYERLSKRNNNNIYDFLIYFIYYIILNKCFQININDIMILLISKLLEKF